MADVSNIQGYNVKDKYAREQIQKIIEEELVNIEEELVNIEEEHVKYLDKTGNGEIAGYLSINNGYGRMACYPTDGVLRLDVFNEAKRDINRRALWLASTFNESYSKLTTAFRLMDVQDGASKAYFIYGTHNKPTGTYTGNGSETQRTIDIPSIGTALLVRNSGSRNVLVTDCGGVCFDLNNGAISYLTKDKIKFQNSVLTIADASVFTNTANSTYSYEVL